ncbi:MAG: serine hydrolase [Pirellulaceae bacterium]
MFSKRIFLLAVCVKLQCALALQADELSNRLQPIIQQHEGTVAVYVKNLTTGETFQHQADHPQPTASLIKLPVMIETYRQAAAGQVNLDAKIVLNESDKVPGSGILTTHFSAGTEISLRDAVQLMIAFSDNTATNLVLDQIGLKSTAETMEKLGLPQTKIHAKVFRRDTSVYPERSQQFGLGSTTAAEMGDLLERLHQGKIVSPEACQTMLDHLLTCDDRTKFVRFLPLGTKVAHKTGAVSNARTDAGIIYSPAAPIVLCVLTNDNADRSWSDDNAANLLCANIAKEVFACFNSDDNSSNTAEATLAVGAMSRLVKICSEP